MSAAAWLGLPLLFFLVASGLGMLAERVVRFALEDALVAPVGTCAALLLPLPVVQAHGSATWSAALIGVLAIAGLVLDRRRLRRRLLPGWPALAGLAALGLYLAPVVLTGHWTWLGYNFVNDTGIHLLMADWVGDHGAAGPSALNSTHDVAVSFTLNAGYPLGGYGFLAALARVLPVDVAALYQPFIACFAAGAAMALASLGRQVGVPAPVAAAIGVLAVGANLTYQYALHGAIKEIALVLVLALAAALTRRALDERLHLGAVVLVTVVVAAGIAVFSAAAAAYAAGIALVALLALLWERARPPLAAVARAAGVAIAALAVALLPVAKDTFSFGKTAGGAFEAGTAIATTVYGHLLRPLPLTQALGVWFRDDYRYPPEPGLPEIATTALIVLGAGLLLAVAVAELRGRRLGALLGLVPALLVYFLASPRLTPYADAKLLVALSPMAVFGAGIGAWWLSRLRLPLGAGLGAVFAAGVLASAAVAYHHARVAPAERLLALRDVTEHARGAQPLLLPEWEELAKYFAGSTPLTVSSEAYSPRAVKLRRPSRVFARSFDLDQMTLEYVTSWPGIVLRRSPVVSRPPADYVRTYRNAYYELWRRRPTPRVLEHLSLPAAGGAGDARPRCRDVRAMARRAAPGERLVGAGRAPTVGFDPFRSPQRPMSWGPGMTPGLLIPFSRARVSARLSLPAARYRVWVRGGGGRALGVRIDGREVGRRQEVNTPGGWLDLGRVSLPPGSHDVELFVPGASPRPGDGYPGEVGRVLLEDDRPATTRTVAPRRAAELCGRAWDWIERVRP